MRNSIVIRECDAFLSKIRQVCCYLLASFLVGAGSGIRNYSARRDCTPDILITCTLTIADGLIVVRVLQPYYRDPVECLPWDMARGT
jgi:hypothetical protein